MANLQGGPSLASFEDQQSCALKNYDWLRATAEMLVTLTAATY